jgi:Flp pilus assembly pilin Flp
VTGVEYALIAGLIAIVVAGGAAFVGPSVSESFVAAGEAVDSTQTTEGADGLCAGVFVSAPVTCDPGLGVSFTGCANGVTGDGSAGAPWACAAPPQADLCAGVFVDAPVTCATGVVDTSMCTNGVTGDGSAGAPWACTPVPVAKSPYSGTTPSASYAVNLGNSGSYALPAIAGIQYAKGACTDQVSGGCGGGLITVSGTTLSTGSGWGSKAATQTITWTIPETDTTLGTSGVFTVRVT